MSVIVYLYNGDSEGLVLGVSAWSLNYKARSTMTVGGATRHSDPLHGLLGLQRVEGFRFKA